MNILKILGVSLALFPVAAANAADAGKVLELLDLTRPGLEKVAEFHSRGNDSLASAALLDYYKGRRGVKSIGMDMKNITLSKTERQRADDGMEHKFYVHDGYPVYFYGKDINWEYWPVKDHELRWQLHRHKWWPSMGKAFRVTGDEKYAAEWVAQYRDWIAKNPLTEYIEDAERVMETADNVYFAWRPLETSGRLAGQIDLFQLFLPSEHFTPEFLIEFLDNYHRHAEFTNTHYSDQGNHLLFEAQYIIQAGAYFPEFKEAAAWRKAGVDILNSEISRQVYADGVQYELDPGYHMGTIESFSRGLRMMDLNGYRGEFPQSYIDTMEKMIIFSCNLMFPDYTQPMFSDNKFHDKRHMMKRLKTWQTLFPDNRMVKYLLSEGKRGALPDYDSHAFADGGFYIMRNGWDTASTVMMLKAGPKGEWHNQYDNGTFELWSNGRNFFPDSGCFIYGGDEEVLKQREWFRRTASHNTLTLDDRTLETRESKLLKWVAAPEWDLTVVETPGYKGLTHRRAVFFVNKKFFVIVDDAYGDADGEVAVHYHLLPCEPVANAGEKSLSTAFDDGNNITLRVFGADKMEAEEGWTSPAYREKHQRPAYAFRAGKRAGKPTRLITVIYPTDSANPESHNITATYKGKPSLDGASLEVTVDGRKYPISYTL